MHLLHTLHIANNSMINHWFWFTLNLNSDKNCITLNQYWYPSSYYTHFLYSRTHTKFYNSMFTYDMCSPLHIWVTLTLCLRLFCIFHPLFFQRKFDLTFFRYTSILRIYAWLFKPGSPYSPLIILIDICTIIVPAQLYSTAT